LTRTTRILCVMLGRSKDKNIKQTLLAWAERALESKTGRWKK
jgi:hypothetical protein